MRPVENYVDTPRITRDLLNDQFLIDNWSQFSDLLTQDPNLSIWKVQHKGGIISTYELFCAVINSWKSRVGNSATLPALISILKSAQFNSAASILEARQQEEQDWIQNNLENFGISHQCALNFVGRKYELQELQNQIDSRQFLTAVTGMTGMGKTSLVEKFVGTQMKLRNGRFLCIWFAHNLKRSVADLLNHFNLNPREEMEVFEQFSLCINHVFTTINFGSTILFVFDTEDSKEFLLKTLKVLGSSRYHHRNIRIQTILIATLLPLEVTRTQHITIKVNELCQEDALTMMQNLLPPPLHPTLESMKELQREWGFSPRALQQAAIIINERNMKGVSSYRIENFLNELKRPSRKRSISNQPLSPVANGDKTITTLRGLKRELAKLQRTKIVGPWALRLVSVLAYLGIDKISISNLQMFVNPTTFLPFENVKGHLNGMKFSSSMRLIKAVSLLKQYHFVSVEDNDVTIYPLFKDLIPSSDTTAMPAMLSILGHIQYNFCGPEDWGKWAVENPKFSILRQEIFKLWEKSLQKLPQDTLRNYARVGVQCSFYPDFPIKLLEKTVSEMVCMFSETSEFVLTPKINYFCRLCLDLESASEGLELLESIVGQMEMVFGNNNPETQRAQNSLILALKKNERWDLYIKQMEKLLLAQNITPLDGQLAIKNILEMAEAYERVGNIEAALQFYISNFAWLKVRCLEESEKYQFLRECIQRCSQMLPNDSVCCDLCDQVDFSETVSFLDQRAYGESQCNNEHQKRVKGWKRVVKYKNRLIYKAKHWNTHDTAKLLMIFKFDFMPHR